MDGYEKTVHLLPPEIEKLLLSVAASERSAVQEIRLRSGGYLTLSTPQGERLVCRGGATAQWNCADAYVCDETLLHESFMKLCEQSVYAHQEELSRGYLTVQGIRVGVSGRAFFDKAGVMGYRRITSLCLRVPRLHDGCGEGLRDWLCGDGALHSILLVGAPSTGKTTLLRDVAYRCAEGYFGRRYRVSVADEREELSIGDRLKNCDVLAGIPKASAVEQAVRCLAPDLLILDELGTLSETEALLGALNSGVAVVGSVHAADALSLCRRLPAVAALRCAVFENIVFLSGREHIGGIDRVMTVEEWEAETHAENIGSALDGGGRRWPRRLSDAPSAFACDGITAL